MSRREAGQRGSEASPWMCRHRVAPVDARNPLFCFVSLLALSLLSACGSRHIESEGDMEEASR